MREHNAPLKNIPREKIYLFNVGTHKKTHGSGNIVLLDSGLCFLQVSVYKKEKGVYEDNLTNNRNLWPYNINGKNIKGRFSEKDVYYLDEIFSDIDNVPLRSFSMK